MQFLVRTLDGREQTIEVQKDTTLDSLKAKIAQQFSFTGTPVILWNETEITDDAALQRIEPVYYFRFIIA